MNHATNVRRGLGIAGLVALAGLVSGAAFAQDASAPAAAPTATTVPGHPRVNEINQRLTNQQNRINAGVANGTITSTQAAHDETRDASIAQRESTDEAKHDGHLTRAEDRNLNKSENRNSKHIHRQRQH